MTLDPNKQIEVLIQPCQSVLPAAGVAQLETSLQSALDMLDLKWVLTRGQWYRPGRVVDPGHQPVASHLAAWAEELEAESGMDGLLDTCQQHGYLATRYIGHSHYFTLPTGENADQFIQIEIEELHEVIERPLYADGWYPESIEEFIDPEDLVVPAQAVELNALYQPRRWVQMPDLIDGLKQESRSMKNLRRFFSDWQQSSASESDHFCRHWILALREHLDSDGEPALTIRPVNTFTGAEATLPEATSLHGAELANLIHSYDRAHGYPFAWFFSLISSKGSNYWLADTVLKDQLGAYDYLAARDLKVLRSWDAKPYSV